MEYKIDPNDPNVSTTAGPQTDKEREWDFLKDYYESNIPMESLISALNLTAEFKEMYPGDETVIQFEKLVRHTICKMFGGTLDFKR